MAAKPWIQLSEYANKYEVSVSTLRRRIKEESIDYKLDAGRYFVADEPLGKKGRLRKGSDEVQPDFLHDGSAIGSAVYFDSEEMSPVSSNSGSLGLEQDGGRPESTVRLAEPGVVNRILDELKKAYSLILQEKEEQIIQLREEITDLRTLAQVLESENTRLRKKLNE